jgi:hypothetical protein
MNELQYPQHIIHLVGDYLFHNGEVLTDFQIPILQLGRGYDIQHNNETTTTTYTIGNTGNQVAPISKFYLRIFSF